MRTIALALAVVVGSDRLQGCPAPATPVDVALAFPDGPGDHGVTTVGCAGWSLQATDAGIQVQPGWTSCALVGWRRDGRLIVDSEPVPLDDAVLHGARSIAFDLPEGAIGGLGIQIVRGVGGIWVQDVVPGSPADQAGLTPGSLIVAVDGVPTEHLSAPAFIRRATGAPGTSVALEVQQRDTRSVDVVRAPIP